MATRAVLVDLAAAWQQAGGPALAIESVGGVDAARRVAAGEAFDLVFLASDALQKLADDGHLRPDSRVGLMHSEVAVAVPQGAERPAIDSEAAVREAVLAASSIGYSTGPSGKALLALFARWGLAEQLQARLVQAPPGVPVGALLARGDIALGFQQNSELQGVAGVDVLGLLPAPIGITTLFGGAVARTCATPERAAAALRFMADPARGPLLLAQGMAPVQPSGDRNDH